MESEIEARSYRLGVGEGVGRGADVPSQKYDKIMR